MRAVLAALAVVVLAAGCGGTKTVTVTETQTTVRTVTVGAATTSTTVAAPPGAAPCAGTDLSGRFALVPGSAGAGNIVYSLRLTNTSSLPCFVSGLPGATLIGGDGSPLPTSVTAAQPGQAAAAKIVLQVGDSAKADARFSPDVPGTGEQQTGQCERKAVVLRVAAPGGGTVAAPISPPTPVCEHGALSFSVLGAG